MMPEDDRFFYQVIRHWKDHDDKVIWTCHTSQEASRYVCRFTETVQFPYGYAGHYRVQKKAKR